jgi:hypothetical protein
MKVNFKVQPFQTEAVEGVVSVFNGQICSTLCVHCKNEKFFLPRPGKEVTQTPCRRRSSTGRAADL